MESLFFSKYDNKQTESESSSLVIKSSIDSLKNIGIFELKFG